MAQPDIIEEFIQKMRFLHEPEYGDFKRKVGLYLERLSQELGSRASDPQMRDSFSKIKNKVVYQPIANVELGRKEVIQWAEQLKNS